MDAAGDRCRAHLWRWRWWIAPLAVAVAIRASLPWALRKVLVAQASGALETRVELANLDLALLRGGVVLEGLAIWAPPRLREETGRGEPAAASPTAETAASTALRAAETAAAEATPAAGTAPAAAAGEERPLIAWKRLAVDFKWLSLFRKRIQLAEVVLDTPSIAIDRLASGELGYERLLEAMAGGSGDGAPPTSGETGAPSAWHLGIDRFALVGGRLRFRDFTLSESEPLDVRIPTIEVRDIALSPDVYGRPSDSTLEVLLDDGSIELRTQLGLDGASLSLDAALAAKRLPLRRSRLYIPQVGWSDLQGEVDADLTYRLVTGRTNQLSGAVTVRDLVVEVPSAPDAALSWQSLTVRIDGIDLLARRATLAEVDLSGAWLLVRPTSSDKLPVLEPGAGPTAAPGSEAAAEAAPAGAPAPGPPAPADASRPDGNDAGTANPWAWSVASLRVSDSGVRVLGDPAPLDVHVGVRVQDLAPAGDKPVKIDLAIGVAPGRLRIAGDAGLAPPGFAGSVRIDGLSLPELITASGVREENPLRSARLDADLSVEAGRAADGATLGPGDLRVRGTMSLADALAATGDTSFSAGRLGLEIDELSLSGLLAPANAAPATNRGDVRLAARVSLAEPRIAVAESKEFSIALRSLGLGITELALPGLLATQPTTTPRPIKIALGQLDLDSPSVRLTRTSDGIVVPAARGFAATPDAEQPVPPVQAPPAPLEPPPARVETAPAGEQAAAAAPVRAPAVPTQSEPSGGIDLSLASLELTRGRLSFVDHTSSPAFSSDFTNIRAEAREVRFPQVAARRVRLRLTTPGEGEILVSGDIEPGRSALDVETREVALAPYNPLVAAYSPYRVASGGLSLQTKVRSQGARYDIASHVRLIDLDIEGAEGESLFEKQFGIPLATALALLRDLDGDITLDVPVQFDERGASVDVATVVGSALRAALVGALVSPLKMVGSLVGGGDKVGTFAPAPVTFAPGRADLSAEGERSLEKMAALLAERPALGVELAAAPALGDDRWLREQALLARWNDAGFIGTLRALAQRATRARVREALEARARGEPEELDGEAAQALERWLEDVPPSGREALAALAAERLARAAAVLEESRGIDASRVQVDEPGSDPIDGPPQVEVKLRPLQKLRRSPAGQPPAPG